MKPVEDAFASDIFRRVILPGIVFAAGVHPFLVGFTSYIGNLYGIGATAIIVAEVILFGLAVSSVIQWIYYVFEGFRLASLTALAGRYNRRRVAVLTRRWAEVQAAGGVDRLEGREHSRALQLYEALLDYPLRPIHGASAEHVAERPTRLGNIIATYEDYAETRYGIDGAFYWDHLLNLANDGARKRFEDAYSFAESLVLASFTGTVVFCLHASTFVGFLLGSWHEKLSLISLPFEVTVSGGLLLFGLLVWFGFYHAALSAHRDAGAALRAIVDSTIPELVEWANSLQVPLQPSALERLDTLTEYLKALTPVEVRHETPAPPAQD